MALTIKIIWNCRYIRTGAPNLSINIRPSLSAGSVRVDTPISVEDAGDVIRDFREISKLGGRVTLKLSDSFDLLPDDVNKAAENAGGTKDNTYAVLHNGRLHLADSWCPCDAGTT
ncbi:MAG: hypothetical protein NTY86_02995 [Deltaproteobacteria bacterium]|nr:hypothetical protein [Deltaproteobacteria bacterium]